MTHSRKPSNDLNILGIDPGTNCGWSYRDANGNHTSGVWHLKGGRYEGGGMRFLRLRVYLDQIRATHQIDMVAYEEVRGHKGTDAAHIYGGVVATIAAFCESEGIPYQGIPVGTVKKHATGKGNASKGMMYMAAVDRWKETITDDNEADARWIAECAAAGLNGGKEAG